MAARAHPAGHSASLPASTWPKLPCPVLGHSHVLAFRSQLTFLVRKTGVGRSLKGRIHYELTSRFLLEGPGSQQMCRRCKALFSMSLPSPGWEHLILFGSQTPRAPHTQETSFPSSLSSGAGPELPAEVHLPVCAQHGRSPSVPGEVDASGPQDLLCAEAPVPEPLSHCPAPDHARFPAPTSICLACSLLG